MATSSIIVLTFTSGLISLRPIMNEIIIAISTTIAMIPTATPVTVVIPASASDSSAVSTSIFSLFKIVYAEYFVVPLKSYSTTVVPGFLPS